MLLVPSITKNLLSVSRFAKDNNVFFEFHYDACFVKDQDSQAVILTGKVKDGLYSFDSSNLCLAHPEAAFNICQSSSAIKSCNVQTCTVSNPYDSIKPNVFDLWHARLGHLSIQVVKTILSQCNVPNINKMTLSFCSSCCLRKIHKFPFSKSETVYTAPLQLIHFDLWGPAPVPSSSGYRYYVHFVDSYSKFTWLYLLKNKSNVIQTFINFKTQVELQLDSKIKAFQSDWGFLFIYRSMTHAMSVQYWKEKENKIL